MYKYRGKKANLWKNLEKKYGAAVLEEHEWPDPETKQSENDEGEEENLDEETSDGEEDGDTEQDL